MMKNEARVKASADWEHLIWSLGAALRASGSEQTAQADLIAGILLLALYFKEYGPAIGNNGAWEWLLSSPLGNVRDALRKCIQALGEQSPTLQQALEILAGHSFDSIGDREIAEVLRVVHTFPIQPDGETRSQIGNVCMVLWASSRLDGAQSASSIPLSKLMVTLANPRVGDRIYDPFAGLGGTLVQAWKHAHSNLESPASANDRSLQGCEINRMTWARAQVLMGIVGIPAVLENGDAYALQSPKDMPTLVISDPPLMVRRDFGPVNHLARRFFPGDVPPAVMDTFASIYQVLADLEPTRGRAVMVVAPRALFGGGAVSRARRNLLEQDVIEAVVGLPKGMVPRTNIALSLLVLNLDKPGPRRGGVLLVSAEELGMAKILGEGERFRLSLDLFEREAIPLIQDAFRDRKNIPGVATFATFDEIEGHEWDLSPNRYLRTEPKPLPKARIEDLAKKYSEVHSNVVLAQDKFNAAMKDIIHFLRDREK